MTKHTSLFLRFSSVLTQNGEVVTSIDMRQKIDASSIPHKRPILNFKQCSVLSYLEEWMRK